MSEPDIAQAAPICEHYWAWVSPAGTRWSARLCMLCHQPDPDWLNHVIEVDRGHIDCVHCEFAVDRNSACGRRVTGGRCTMGFGHDGDCGQVGLR